MPIKNHIQIWLELHLKYIRKLELTLRLCGLGVFFAFEIMLNLHVIKMQQLQ